MPSTDLRNSAKLLLAYNCFMGIWGNDLFFGRRCCSLLCFAIYCFSLKANRFAKVHPVGEYLSDCSITPSVKVAVFNRRALCKAHVSVLIFVDRRGDNFSCFQFGGYRNVAHAVFCQRKYQPHDFSGFRIDDKPVLAVRMLLISIGRMRADKQALLCYLMFSGSDLPR